MGTSPKTLTAGGPQNDGPDGKRWTPAFKYGHFWGIYVRFLRCNSKYPCCKHFATTLDLFVPSIFRGAFVSDVPSTSDQSEAVVPG